MDQTQHYGNRAVVSLGLTNLINNWGFNLIDIANDSEVRFEALNQFRHGNYDALTEAEADRVAKLAAEFAAPEREYAEAQNQMGRKIKRRLAYHEFQDAGINVEEYFGVKL